MDNEDMAYTHTHTHTSLYMMAYCSVIKKNVILSFATTWINIQSIMLNETSQTEKDKCHVVSLICGI